MQHPDSSPMFVSLRGEICFIMLIKCPTEDSRDLSSVCRIVICNIPFLNVTHHTTHMFLGKQSPCRSYRTTEQTTDKIMTVSHRIQYDGLEIWIDIPVFQVKIFKANKTIQFTIKINSTSNTIFVISDEKMKGRFPTSLVILSSIIDLPENWFHE